MKFINSSFHKLLMIFAIVNVIFSKKAKSNIFPRDIEQSSENKESILYYLHEISNPNNISDKTIFMFLMIFCLISILIKLANNDKTMKDNMHFDEDDINLKGRAKQNAKNVDYSILDKKKGVSDKEKPDKKVVNQKKDMYRYIDSLYHCQKQPPKEKKTNPEGQQMTQEKLFDYIFNK